ncbi:T9SS type A sorting domain-containing protein [Bacteroidota bacterium]
MKKFTLLFIAGIMLGFNTYSQTTDAVSMGASYANEIYYSFENGEVKSEARNNWDIAFYTTIWSAGIMVNDGNNVVLYNYPNSDTSGWMTMDTTGISGWEPMYNSEELWEDGGFNKYQKGHPDYGWGAYNPVTHDVEGDSLYFLKLASGEYKKIWIQKKESINNTYYFKYADLDNSNEITEVLDINPYTAKNFAYYSLASESALNREPDTNTWDIVFTKYQAIHPTGGYVSVTGVCNNLGVYSNKFEHVGPDFVDWGSMPFDSTKAAIGWNWKEFDLSTFTYQVVDSTAYFVKTKKGDIYKLVFVDFAGSSSGNIIFTYQKITANGIADQIGQDNELSIYPNPANDFVNITSEFDNTQDINIQIISMNGEVVYNNKGINKSLRIPVSGWAEGVYVVVLTAGEKVYREKLIIN